MLCSKTHFTPPCPTHRATGHHDNFEMPHQLPRLRIKWQAVQMLLRQCSSSSYCDQECSFEARRRPLGDSSSSPRLDPASPIVALGKFDAMHRGHQALAKAASGMGSPWLVSFAGMAEVLGWPARLPLVAPCDRRRVLQTWAGPCGGRVPSECAIPFAEVRSLSPEAFVRLLAEDLGVAGVVVGSNYRFGYRAAGTAALLADLGPAHGMTVVVVDLVEDSDAGSACVEAVSSSRVREALAAGDLAAAAECLDRPYRLVVDMGDGGCSAAGGDAALLQLSAAAYNNEPPRAGVYRVQAQVAATGQEVRHAQLGMGIDTQVRVHKEGLEWPAGVVHIPGGKLLLDFTR